MNLHTYKSLLQLLCFIIAHRVFFGGSGGIFGGVRKKVLTLKTRVK